MIRSSIKDRKVAVALLLALFLAVTATTGTTITIPTVLIGDAGNSADSSGYGAVGYDFHISTHPVTNIQYTAFLNSVAAGDPHGLYHSDMGSTTHGGITRSGTFGSFTYSVKAGYANKPVNFVSFWHAARFTNWLTTGNTETGVYHFSGVSTPRDGNLGRDATAWENGGVAVAGEDEWYKAAYYDPTKDSSGGYWPYGTRSNTITTTDANYNYSVGTVTEVNRYSHAPSYYGTLDQTGNVFEWIDVIVNPNDDARVIRGGSFGSNTVGVRSSQRFEIQPASTNNASIGFRVSSLTPIPEPSSYAALLGLSAVVLAFLRRLRVQCRQN